MQVATQFVKTPIAAQLSLLETAAPAPMVTNSKEKASIKGTIINDLGGNSLDLWFVDPRKTKVVDGLNPRIRDEEYEAHIESLCDSMEVNGFYRDKPLAGYVVKVNGENVLYIYEGGSRREAAIRLLNRGKAKFQTVPMTVSQDKLDMSDMLVSIVRGNDGKRLKPYEIGVICLRLDNLGMDTKTIAKRLGITEQYVGQLLAIMAAPEDLKVMVASGVVSAANAHKALQEHGEKALEVLQSALGKVEKTDKQGRKRITDRHMAGAAYKTALRKSAEPMLNVLAEVKADPAFASLSAETQAKLAELLEAVEKAKAADAVEAPAEAPAEAAQQEEGAEA